MFWKIPYFSLSLGEEEKAAVMHVLDKHWLAMGEEVSAFENAFAQYLNSDNHQAIAVSSGTAALHLAALALDLKAGDEAICPALTFVATANAIRYTGATPVFADIKSTDDWTIDPKSIEKCITPKTKAIFVVHYGGYPCDMPEILALAKRHQLFVVEDAAHAHGSQFQGKHLGTWGDIGCFSLYSNKNMTSAEGGMVVTANPLFREKIRSQRSHGMTSTTYSRAHQKILRYDITQLGFNYRMDEIRAAIGRVQLGRLNQFNQRRASLVRYYRESIHTKLPELQFPFDKPYNEPLSHHIFPILVPQGFDRDEVMDLLGEVGIQTSIHYRPIHHMQFYRDFPCQLPITDSIGSRIISLPLYPDLKEEQIDFMMDAFKDVLHHKTRKA